MQIAQRTKEARETVFVSRAPPCFYDFLCSRLPGLQPVQIPGKADIGDDHRDNVGYRLRQEHADGPQKEGEH